MRTRNLKALILSSLLTAIFGLSAEAQTTVLSADPQGNPNGIYVVYSPGNGTAMDPVSSTNLANYSLTNSFGGVVPITNATLAANQSNVFLALGASLQLFTNYTITISNVQDTSANVITPNPTSVNFYYGGNPNGPTYTFDNGALPPNTSLWPTGDAAGNNTNLAQGVTNSGGFNNTGMLIMSEPAGGGNGQSFTQWLLPDYAGGKPITNLVLTFNLFMGGGNGGDVAVMFPPAGGNGMLFHWGGGLLHQYTGGASSFGTGLDVTFRSYSSAPNTPGVNIYYGGTAGAGNNAPLVNNPFEDYYYGSVTNFNSNTLVQLTINTAVVAGKTNATINLVCSNAWDGPTNIYTGFVITNFQGLSGGSNVLAFTSTDGAGAHEFVFLDNVDFVVNHTHIVVPPSVGPVGFSLQPASKTTNENVEVTFTSAGSGAPPYYYQWYSNGVAIAAATNANYTTPLTLFSNMNGAAYSVGVSNNFSSATSTNAILTIIRDTNGVQVVSVGSLDGNSIGILFSGYVDVATAGNPLNYSVNGGAVSVTAAALRTNNIANFGDPVANYIPAYLKTVRLTLGSTVASGYTVTVSSNVVSRTIVARPFNTNLVGIVQGMSDVDVGAPGTDPIATGEGFSGGNNQVEVIASGSDIMAIAAAGFNDHGNYAYLPRTGDFDVIAGLTWETLTANGAKVGLMVRSSVADPGSPALSATVFPAAPGRSTYETAVRTNSGSVPASWAALGQPANGDVAAFWPGNSWIRIKRLGPTFEGFISSDGISWTLIAQAQLDTNNFPPAENVGLVACANFNDGRYTEADFLNFGPVAFATAGVTFITNLNASYATNEGTRQTFTVAAAMSVLNVVPASELVYQWQRAEPGSPTVFNDIIDGTGNGSSYTTPYLTTANDNGARYRVIAFVGDVASGNSATSSVATLSVGSPLQAKIVSVAADATFLAVTVNFSEPMDPSSADTAGNYTITPVGGGTPITVSGATLSPNGTTVVLTLASALAPGVQYTLAVGAVYDAYLAFQVNNSKVFTAWQLAYGFLRYDRWNGPQYPNGAGPYFFDVAHLFTDPNYPNSPDATEIITYSGYPNGDISNPIANTFDFSARISGFFIPPTNGNYQFYLRGNDGVALWVSSTNTPPDPTIDAADLTAVDNETFIGSPGRSWLWSITNVTVDVVGLESRNGTPPLPIPMVGGQPYALVAIDQQANGTSWIEFTWGLPYVPGVETNTWDGGLVTDTAGAAYPTAAGGRGGAPTNTYNITGTNIAMYVNPDLSVLTATGPSNATAFACNTATFSVAASASVSIGNASAPAPVTYQWAKNGTNIIGATSSSYTTPSLQLSDSNSVFSVVVTAAGLSFVAPVTNSATLSVLPLAVAVSSLSSFGGTSIGILYNQAMDPASVTNPANYSVSGTVVQSVQLRPDGRTVLVTVSPALSGPTFTVTLNNVKDACSATPITPNTQVTGNVLFTQLTAIDIGVATSASPPGVVQTNNTTLTNVTFNLSFPGSPVMAVDGVFQVLASGHGFGADGFGTSLPQDGLHYIYEQRSGDFDVAVHVEQVNGSDARAKAGLMLRENLLPGSREYAIVVDPAATNAADAGTNVTIGYNGVETIERTTANANLASFPTTSLNGINTGPNPPVLANSSGVRLGGGLTNMYPLWLRMRRTGNNVYVYTGGDGTNWYLCARDNALAANWPTTSYFGMATTAANVTNYTQSQFSHYGNYVAPSQKQALMLSGGDVGGTGNQIGLVNGGSYGSPSALDTPAGNPNAPALQLTSTVFLYNMLLGMGYNITVVHAASSATEDGVGKTLIMWGGDCQSGDTSSNGKWVALAVPEIAWKYSSYEKNYWLGNSADRGNPGSKTAIKIVNTNNPIVQGLYPTNAVVQVVSSAQFFSYGTSNDLAHAGTGFTIVGVDPATPANALLFYADVGTALYSSSTGATPTANTFTNKTPARRVGLWMGDNSSAPVGDWSQSTPGGLVLLTNAINWAVGITTNLPTLAGPANQTVPTNQPATFSVVASGPGPFTYQWIKNGGSILGAVYADYTTPPTTGADNGAQFQVVVTGLYGSVTSSIATLTLEQPVVITAQPQNATVPADSSANFTVGIASSATNGSATITYRWYQINGVNTTLNATQAGVVISTNYTTPLLWGSNSGNGFYVVVSNAVNAQTSTTATVTVPRAQFGPSLLVNGTNLSLTWSNGGILEAKTNLLVGPWVPILTNGTSPTTYTITNIQSLPQRFFRIQQ